MSEKKTNKLECGSSDPCGNFKCETVFFSFLSFHCLQSVHSTNLLILKYVCDNGNSMNNFSYFTFSVHLDLHFCCAFSFAVRTHRWHVMYNVRTVHVYVVETTISVCAFRSYFLLNSWIWYFYLFKCEFFHCIEPTAGHSSFSFVVSSLCDLPIFIKHFSVHVVVNFVTLVTVRNMWEVYYWWLHCRCPGFTFFRTSDINFHKFKLCIHEENSHIPTITR